MALRQQLPISPSGDTRTLDAIPEPAMDEGAITGLSRMGVVNGASDCPVHTIKRSGFIHYEATSIKPFSGFKSLQNNVTCFHSLQGSPVSVPPRHLDFS